jgi:prophage tail gpP-like protein
MPKSHKVESGETLGSISIKYLGTFQKWKLIVTANPQLSSRRLIADGSPTIFPGDILAIPDEDKSAVPMPPQTETVKLSEAEQDISILIDGFKFLGFTSYEITLSYDSFDVFSFSAPYDIAEKEISDVIMPFAFKNCDIFYNGKLQLKGTLLTPDPELVDKSKEITLQGYPLCGILNDCTIPLAEYPAEYAGLTLKEIAEPIVAAYGIKTVFDDDPGGPFDSVAIEPTEKVLDFLVKLSKQRSLLFSNNEKGCLRFFTPKEETPFTAFEEGHLPLISIKPKFNAQNFFSHIIEFTKTGNENPSLEFVYENKYLTQKGITRCQTIVVDDADTSTDLENAVKAYAGRMFAECVSYELECEGHANANGEVFKKGMTVCVKAPGAMIIRETNFKAREITLKRTKEGKTASMTLVLPGSYDGNIPEVLPWE